MIKISKQLDKFITEALAIEERDAREAGALGYMARALVQATMPHKKVLLTSEFSRTSGAYTLTILAPTKFGLPYGAIPRLLLSWITTEAVRTKQRKIVLGSSLSNFMEQLGLVPTGGRWGSITRLRDQIRRLFSSTVSCYYGSENASTEMGFRIADKHTLWWDPKNPLENDSWNSAVTLTEAFFNEITSRPVPIDMDALKALKRSPLALDIYCWLTYRMSYLKASTEIPWKVLEMQFGSDYKDTKVFKWKFINHLRKISIIYPQAKIRVNNQGLLLKPSQPHIPLRNG